MYVSYFAIKLEWGNPFLYNNNKKASSTLSFNEHLSTYYVPVSFFVPLGQRLLLNLSLDQSDPARTPINYPSSLLLCSLPPSLPSFFPSSLHKVFNVKSPELKIELIWRASEKLTFEPTFKEWIRVVAGEKLETHILNKDVPFCSGLSLLDNKLKLRNPKPLATNHLSHARFV